MTKVNFYETADDSLLKFAVIAAVHSGRLVFCKHRERSTYEIPGGHREENEDITETARRELREETGAIDFDLSPVCVYSVTGEDGRETFGMLFFAHIKTFESELHSEIEKIILADRPESWTYPLIQPRLLEEVKRRGFLS